MDNKNNKIETIIIINPIFEAFDALKSWVNATIIIFVLVCIRHGSGRWVVVMTTVRSNKILNMKVFLILITISNVGVLDALNNTSYQVLVRNNTSVKEERH